MDLQFVHTVVAWKFKQLKSLLGQNLGHARNQFLKVLIYADSIQKCETEFLYTSRKLYDWPAYYRQIDNSNEGYLAHRASSSFM